ncbi:BglG family transcription antiterminator [Bacillus weihaiensis]|uniref:BglG family transcription antiterminator n=1 Tax=Bacillus weihaiensis TaxID=1547283 RepID=UPI002354A5A0|nr:BglG family transcription antiterminator [Bacillus weihaiensis]
MNNRQREIIIQLLKNQGQPILVDEIAKKMGCSEKTVRNDLKSIETILDKFEKTTLIRKPGLGVFIVVEKEDEHRLYSELQLTALVSDVDEEQIRMMDITYELLMSKKPLTLHYVAKKLFVSHQVLKSDLERIEKWLKTFDLELVVKQKVGLYITGSEVDKRRCLANLSLLIRKKKDHPSYLKETFSPYEIQIVEEELVKLQQSHSLFYTDETNERLILHILVAVRRLKLGHTISYSEISMKGVKERDEFEWSKKLLKKFEIPFVIFFPEQEIAYFTLQLIGAKRRYTEHPVSTPSPQIGDLDLQAIMRDLVNGVAENTGIEFQKDAALSEGLFLHLYSAVNRITYGLSMKNPLLDDIKRKYPYLFNGIMSVLFDMSKVYKLIIPEEEAAYLTIHFQASVERMQGRKTVLPQVIIVCHLGIGMSRLLQVRTEEKVKGLDVIGCIAKAELKEFLKNHKVDFIISTVDLPNSHIPYVVINPLFDEEDQNKVKDMVKDYNVEKKRSVLSTLVKEDLFFAKQAYTHRYKAIEDICNVMYEKGYVTKEYAQSAIARERASSTAIGFRVSIPHGDPTLIRRPVIAIATCQDPLEWGNEMVSLLFLIAMPQYTHKETKALFKELSNISQDPVLIEKLVSEETFEGFCELLNGK